MALTTQNAETALALAAAGFSVFPCHSGGEKAKQPMPFIKWRDVSTTDERQIRQWWQRWPDAAPGLDLAKTELIVIDCDRHDPKADGIAAFGALAAEHQHDIDMSPLVATPNEGSHVYFRRPPGKAMGNGKGTLPPGVDVRGHGGFVIAPGTVMQDGRLYELFGSLVDAPELPTWLIEILEAKRGGALEAAKDTQGAGNANVQPGAVTFDKTTAGEIEDLLSHIPASCGYEDWLAVLMAIHAATGGAGFDLADRWSATGGAKYPGSKDLLKKWASFKRSGISGRTLAQIARANGADLSAIAIKHMAPDHDAIEAAAAARTLIEAHDGTLSDAVTGEVFDTPTEYDEDFGAAADYIDIGDDDLRIPGVVGEIADWICEWTGEPIRIHAVGAALVTVGTLLSRKVFTKTRPTGAHLYIGAIAPSGWGKDHPQNCIKIILDAVSGPGSKMHLPWASSAPSIGMNMLERAGAVMIADEFAEKFAATRSSNASVSTAAINEVFKELWGRGQGSYGMPSTVSRGNLSILWPALSFYGAATIRDFKESLVSKDVTSGLYNRFLFLPRYGAVEMRPDIDGMVEVPDRLISRCKWLYDCLDPFQVSMAIRGDGRPAAPLMVPFSKAAEEMNEANRQVQRRMQIASDEDAALSIYGRYAEQIKRVALIVACGRSPENLKVAEITENDMAFGEKIVRWSIEQTVLMIRHDMVENWIEANRAKVIGYIRKRRKVSRSELLRKVRSIKGEDLDKIIKYLQEAECIDILKAPTKGRDKVFYEYLRG